MAGSIEPAKAMKLHRKGLGDTVLARKLGVTTSAVAKWRKRNGLASNVPAHCRAMDPAEARALHAGGASDTAIARHFGIDQSAVTRWRQRYGIPPNAHRPPALTPEQRRVARKMLRDGMSKRQVATAIGCCKETIRRLRAKIADDTRLRRTGQTVEARRRAAVKDAASLLDQLRNATRYMTDPMLRDDVISEMYLALMEGTLKPEAISVAARAYSGRAMNEWQSRWAPVSLDEDLAGDGFRLVDTIPCPRAEAWLDGVGA